LKKISYIVFDHDGTLVNTSGFPRSLYPGMKDLLKFLKNEEVKLFVWTARSRASTVSILEEQGILSYFEDICGSDNAAGKPSAAGIEFLLPGVKPENVIVIGDSLGDIIGGSKFGAHCIGAMWGHGDASAESMYAEYGAKNSFIEINKLKEYIEKLI
jgi:phosphoglycolate phosphatase-like HAD superfamily hydrolase